MPPDKQHHDDDTAGPEEDMELLEDEEDYEV